MPDATLETITRSFRSKTCPSCGNTKQQSHAFCTDCFTSLPIKQRNDLYKRFGKGFEGAWREGCRHLGVTEPRMPVEALTADQKMLTREQTRALAGDINGHRHID